MLQRPTRCSEAEPLPNHNKQTSAARRKHLNDGQIPTVVRSKCAVVITGVRPVQDELDVDAPA